MRSRPAASAFATSRASPSRSASLPRRWLWVASIAVAAIGLALVLVIRLAPGSAPVATSPTSSNEARSSAAATASTSSTPGRSPSPQVTAPATTVKGVEAHALPQLTDQWVFLLTRTFTFSPNDPNLGPLPAHDSVKAVRVSDRSEVTVAAFTSAVTTVTVDNLLREQFSPDGRQLVLSVVIGDTGRERAALVIVDLATGAVRQLTMDAAYNDLQPAWSPTANGIAFARTRIGAGDAGIWVVDAGGAIPPR